ncbi:MAG: hypothetical protein ABI878_10105 [Acidobacteriota bacterium]
MEPTTLVKLRAVAWTVRDPEDVRDRTLRGEIDPDLILNAPTLSDALYAFYRVAPHVGEITDFKYFEIGGHQYGPGYWQKER